jgi:2-(1,2-epoxy-1,2-dihydrophenyl)acetyl-CoA isomerase
MGTCLEFLRVAPSRECRQDATCVSQSLKVEPDFMADELIRADSGQVARLTLNRPDRLNACTRAMLSQLSDALSDIAQEDSVRAVVIAGAGRGFCAGQDLGEHGAVDDGPAARNMLERHYNPVIRQIRALDRPVMAAVNGVAAGAGCGLALACDLVLASATASFSFVFTRIGLMPDAGLTYFLPRLLGHARALGVGILGETVDAPTAAQWGLIWKSSPEAEFDNDVAAMAQKLAQLPTAAIALLKHAIDAGEHHSLEQQLALEAELQRQAADTEDYQEGRAAFFAKRPAKFIGR